MYLPVKALHPDAKLPTYAYGPHEDAGMDLHAVEDVTLTPWSTKIIRTGIAVDIPSGVEMQIRPRGGLSFAGLRILNSPGTVDPGFRGEIKVLMRWEPDLTEASDNTLRIQVGTNGYAYNIVCGQRIAQAVFMRYMTMEPHWHEELSKTRRDTGMLGSSGR